MQTVHGKKLSGTVTADDTAFLDCDLSGAMLNFDRTGKVEFSDCRGLDRAKFSVEGEPVSYEAFAQAVRDWQPTRPTRPTLPEQEPDTAEEA